MTKAAKRRKYSGRRALGLVEIDVDVRLAEPVQPGDRAEPRLDLGDRLLDLAQQRQAVGAVVHVEDQRHGDVVVADQALAAEQVGAGGELPERGELFGRRREARLGAPVDREQRVGRHARVGLDGALERVDLLDHVRRQRIRRLDQQQRVLAAAEHLLELRAWRCSRGRWRRSAGRSSCPARPWSRSTRSAAAAARRPRCTHQRRAISAAKKRDSRPASVSMRGME